MIFFVTSHLRFFVLRAICFIIFIFYVVLGFDVLPVLVTVFVFLILGSYFL
jgi:hypothetical protein